jgi:RNA polymerase sigma-70 factor (ECF subfamily)
MSPPPRSDEELLAEAQRAPDGDLRAFEELVHRYRGTVTANCRYLTRGSDVAEDLAQEVFVKAYFGLPRFEGRAAFRTWLRRIKVNHCINHLKRERAATFVPIDDPDAVEPEDLSTKPQAERALGARDRRAMIGQVLDAMSDTLRIPLILRDLDQMAYEEIAETLGLGLSAVKMRIKRAREEFKSRFRELLDAASAETA